MVENGVSTLLVYDGKPLGVIHVLDIIRASMPEAEPQLQIVGLGRDEMEFRYDIYRTCIDSLKKIQKVLPIELARLTIKAHKKTGGKSKYTMRFLISGKKTIETSAFDWKLFNALHYVLREAERKAFEQKERIGGRKSRFGKLRALSVRIQEGELYLGKPVK